MNLMKYKSYSAKVEFSEDDDLLVGEVCDIDALILFSASSIPELKIEFHHAIDAYLLECEARGVAAQKPCSGTFNVRVGGELHRKAATIARTWNVSLNQVVCAALEQVIDRHCHQSPVTHSQVVEQSVGFTGYDQYVPLMPAAPRSVYEYN